MAAAASLTSIIVYPSQLKADRDQSPPLGPILRSQGDVIEGFWSREQLFPGRSLLRHWRQHCGFSEGDHLGHYNMPQLSQLNNVPA